MAKLETQWSNPQRAKLSFALGPEHFLASRAYSTFKTRLLAAHPELELAQIADGEYSDGAIVELAAPSLFQEPRLIEVQGLPEAAIPELERFLATETQDVYVWVRVAGSPALVTKLRKAFPDTAQFVICDEIKRDADKIAFAKSELAARDKQISPDALRLLVSAFASDLAELAGACSQLANHPAKKLESEHIDQAFSGRVETTVFKVSDAAFAGDAAEAVRLLRHALNTGADPVMMVGAFASRVRQLCKLISNPRLSAEALGVQPWMLDRVRKDLAGWSEPALARLLRRTAVVDAAVKGASRDPEFVLESYLLAIANRRG